MPEKLTNYDTESIAYSTMLAGIQRAGFVAFPISSRNSPAAVAHLLSKTTASHVFVGSDLAVQELAVATFEVLKQGGAKQPDISTMPVFEELYTQDSNKAFVPLSPVKPTMDDLTIVMHSSGNVMRLSNLLCLTLLTMITGTRLDSFPEADRMVTLQCHTSSSCTMQVSHCNQPLP